MSELIDNGGLAPKDLPKHLILQLHVGAAPARVQEQLVRMKRALAGEQRLLSWMNQERPMTDCAATITPESRIGDLLQRWPELEDVLVDLSPHFRALRNPVLRRTVAKVATLRQVSAVSGVALGVLVSTLRAGAGLAPAAVEDEGAAAAAERPAWAVEREVTRTHDARAAIEAGEHPMPRVMADLAALPEGEVYALVTPFVPAPLVDLARGKGFASFSVTEGDALVRTYFRRSGGAREVA